MFFSHFCEKIFAGAKYGSILHKKHEKTRKNEFIPSEVVDALGRLMGGGVRKQLFFHSPPCEFVDAMERHMDVKDKLTIGSV